MQGVDKLLQDLGATRYSHRAVLKVRVLWLVCDGNKCDMCPCTSGMLNFTTAKD